MSWLEKFLDLLKENTPNNKKSVTPEFLAGFYGLKYSAPFEYSAYVNGLHKNYSGTGIRATPKNVRMIYDELAKYEQWLNAIVSKMQPSKVPKVKSYCDICQKKLDEVRYYISRCQQNNLDWI